MKTSENTFVRAAKNYFKQNWGILAALLAMCVLFTIFGNNFLTTTNIINLLRTCATNCYLAIGVQLAIILAGIDLTGGALAALSGVLCVMTFETFGLPMPVGILVGILIGVVVGFLNGAVITYTGIHPFVVTLAMQSVCRGAAYLLANGSPVTTRNASFGSFGTGTLGIIPYPVIYMTVFLILDYLLLNKLRTGRHIYAVGGNEMAQRVERASVPGMFETDRPLSGADCRTLRQSAGTGLCQSRRIDKRMGGASRPAGGNHGIRQLLRRTRRSCRRGNPAQDAGLYTGDLGGRYAGRKAGFPVGQGYQFPLRPGGKLHPAGIYRH